MLPLSIITISRATTAEATAAAAATKIIAGKGAQKKPETKQSHYRKLQQ